MRRYYCSTVNNLIRLVCGPTGRYSDVAVAGVHFAIVGVLRFGHRPMVCRGIDPRVTFFTLRRPFGYYFISFPIPTPWPPSMTDHSRKTIGKQPSSVGNLDLDLT